jgi:hypothetical protein
MPARPYVSPPDQGKRPIEEAASLLDHLDLESVPDTVDPSALSRFFPEPLARKGIEKALLELMAGFSPSLATKSSFNPDSTAAVRWLR